MAFEVCLYRYMSQNIPDQFFEKLKNQQQTAQDHERFAEWLRNAPETEIEQVLDKYSWYFENLADEPHPESNRLISLIENKINDAEAATQHDENKLKRYTLWPVIKRVTAAAAIIGAVCLYYYNSRQNNEPEYTNQTTSKIVPGGNKAVLTLADGSTIILDSAANGTLANQSNVRIYKTGNGRLVYDASHANVDDKNALALNTIATPRGGQYQVILPDGTKVWLNAESSLSYPAHFSGTERNVKLNGEAYFEVAKDKKHPFRVNINDMRVEVLGTHFNIMGYNNEAAIKTTLLEGSVKIIKGSQQQMIVPGEQAIVSSGISVAKVNVDEAVEWKNGNFNFAHENLESIMRKIARWYDIDVAYQGKNTSASFVGTIPRSQSIQEVLKYLELTGLVHFKITERRVTAMP